MSRVQLYPHPGTNTWTNVQLAGGVVLPRFVLGPNEAWVDHKGVVHQMSLRAMEDEVMNLVLLPQDTSINAVLKVTRDWLVPLGLSVGAEALSGGNIHLASEAAAQVTEIVIGHYIDERLLRDSAYFCMGGGRPLILTSPLEAR